jgi:hypothetical protein
MCERRLRCGQDDYTAEPVLQSVTIVASPIPQLRPLHEFAKRDEGNAWLPADKPG